jgi:hypothetical protein
MFLLEEAQQNIRNSTKGASASGQGNALLIRTKHRICPEGAKASPKNSVKNPCFGVRKRAFVLLNTH